MKSEFDNQHTVLAGKELPKIAQSSKSKVFHFRSKICKQCNSKNSQPADRAFDDLHKNLKNLYEIGQNITDLHDQEIKPAANNSELNQFRYFAKIICCYMAEVSAPRPVEIASFAIGNTNRNPIFLKISIDENYERSLKINNTKGFAEHGGLKFRFDDKKRLVKSIESSIKVGGIHYEFWVQLSWLASLELRIFYPTLMRVSLENIISE